MLHFCFGFQREMLISPVSLSPDKSSIQGVFMSFRQTDGRRSEFKNQGLTQDEFRRRREETSVELRKTKKEDALNKRRNIVELPVAPVDNEDNTQSRDSEVKDAPSPPIPYCICF